jgi:protein-S-isoprenylcysteine O-methyltransferase Ste14
VILGTLLLVSGGDVRARAEEEILSEQFGGEYQAYLQRVNRAIPGVY